MKTTKLFSVLGIVLFSLAACENKREAKVLSLTSGEEVYVVEDENGIMVDRETKKPVLLYVDKGGRDTIYGPTKKVVNGKIERMDDGVYLYDDGGERKIKIDNDEYKIKDGEVKIKRENGEYKYKDEDGATIKVEDDYKYERDGYTKKVDKDGDVKIETRDTKTKIDGETGEVKTKKKSVFSKVKDKVTGQ
jgi:hypothetical protein